MRGGEGGGEGREGRGGRLWHIFQNRHTYKYSLAIGCIKNVVMVHMHSTNTHNSSPMFTCVAEPRY